MKENSKGNLQYIVLILCSPSRATLSTNWQNTAHQHKNEEHRWCISEGLMIIACVLFFI